MLTLVSLKFTLVLENFYFLYYLLPLLLLMINKEEIVEGGGVNFSSAQNV